MGVNPYAYYYDDVRRRPFTAMRAYNRRRPPR